MTETHVARHESGRPGSAGPGPGWQARFAAIFCGQACSLIGSALTQFVLLWWITDTTGSVSALALAGLAALLPQALLSPLGGTLADRYSRRMLMIVPDVISAACMLVLIALFLADAIALWHIYTMMAVRSAMQAFQAPAAAASVAMLVPPAFLSRAAGLNQTVQGMTLLAAAPLGAVAISLMPLGWALSIDVVTALLGILPLLRYRIPQTYQKQVSSLWHEFRDGVHLVWQNPGLRSLYALMGMVVLVVMPSFTLVPLLVKTHFGGGAPAVALMEALAGAGIMAGGLLVAVLAPKRLVTWILCGFAASCLTLALTGWMPAQALHAAMAWWMISGLAFIMGNAPLVVLLQRSIPNHLQGRALSLLNMTTGLAAPIGLALSTPLGEWIGVRWLFVCVGVSGTLVCLAGFASASIRQLDQGAARVNENKAACNETNER